MRPVYFRTVLGAIVVCALFLSACSSTSTSSDRSGTPTTSPAPSGTSATSAKPYGSLVIAGDFGGGALDPQAEAGPTFRGLGAAVLDTPIFLNSEDKRVPGIAERWEIAPDGMALTFYIRRGIKFHDGSDLTGADVKFSIERMVAPQGKSSAAAIWRQAIASVELKDEHTVVVHWKTPQFELMRGIDDDITAVVPKKYIEEKGVDYFGKNPIGSGPWKVVKWELGNRLELEAVESHWRAVPQFKNLTVLNVPEEGTKIAMLKTGELDIARISPDSVAGLKAAGLRIMSWAGGQTFLMYVFYDAGNPGKYAVSDVRVRKALALAMNRKEMIDNIFGGNGNPTVVYPVSQGAYFFDPNVMKVDPYDPEQAKKLMAEAAYPNGFSTRFYDTVGQGALGTIDLAIVSYWRRIGVNAEVVPIEYGAIKSKISPGKSLPEIWNSFWTYPAALRPDFSQVVQTYYPPLSQSTNQRNPKLEELLEKVPGVADPAERKRLAIEAVLMAKNEYSALPLLDVNTIIAYGSKVGGVTPFATAQYFMAKQFDTITHAK